MTRLRAVTATGELYCLILISLGLSSPRAAQDPTDIGAIV